MRLLVLEIQEPLPGLVLPDMAAECGPAEAARRYRAIVLTTLRQLRFLSDSRLRLQVSPADADEAVRFWLLPKLAERWQSGNGIFRNEGWEIDFGGDEADAAVVAKGNVLCPNLGARWVHTALLGMGNSVGHVIGPATGGGKYFEASAMGTDKLPSRVLPELPVIANQRDWNAAMDSALGASLKKAWEEEV